ncbi:MAG: hypothetical protein N3F09_04320 [Bacteroidia bacterium]|nr:hypothetical protein [Bacteroidia bacterium]
MCLVFTKSKYTFTNENGEFKLNINAEDKYLYFYKSGYLKDSLPLPSSVNYVFHRLKKNIITLDEVNILSYNYPFVLRVLRQIKGILESKYKPQSRRAYFRSYTFFIQNTDTLPAEYFDAYYTCKISAGGIENPELTSGYFLLPNHRLFINNAGIHYLKKFRLIERNHRFPIHPLQSDYLDDVKDEFNLQIMNAYTENKDTVFQINFSPRSAKKDTINFFKGQILYSHNRHEILNLKMHNCGFRRHGLLSLSNRNDTVTVKNLDLDVYFKNNIPEIIILRLVMAIHSDMKYELYETNMKFFTLDEEKDGTLTYFPDYYKSIFDYDKVFILPALTDSSGTYQPLKAGNTELSVAEKIRKGFYFDSREKSAFLGIVKARFIPIYDSISFTGIEIPEKFQINPYEVMHEEFEIKTKRKKQKDSAYIFGFPVIQYNKGKLRVVPVLDLWASYCLKKSPGPLLSDFMVKIKKYSHKLEQKYAQVLSADEAYSKKKIFASATDDFMHYVHFLNGMYNKLINSTSNK